MTPHRQKVNAALLSIGSNTFLVALKTIAGAMIGSVAIVSEAIHSGMDLLAAAIAFTAVKFSGKPADRGHPFGHGKAENLAGAAEAILIFTAAGWIIYKSILKFIHPRPIDEPAWGAGIMLVSAVINWFVSRRLFIVGKKTDSIALEADAWHLRMDVWTSAGVMAGLGAIWIGGCFFPSLNLQWVDPAAALLVAAMILKAAYDLTMKSIRDLLDAGLAAEEDEKLRALIAAHDPQIRGFHNLRARKSGGRRFIEFHILVNSEMTVARSHKLTDELTVKIMAIMPDSLVTIHVEPCKTPG
ncbi:MAG: cation diffusion facilitator family transporter [Kiritimatiellae bacterium]|nr:cation diffusion facilitator family transporter [Kiritimatiellia bacterium]